MASLTVESAGKALDYLTVGIRYQYEALPGEDDCCVAFRKEDIPEYWHGEIHDLKRRNDKIATRLYDLQKRRQRKADRLRLSRQMARYTRLGIKWKMGVL